MELASKNILDFLALHTKDVTDRADEVDIAGNTSQREVLTGCKGLEAM